MQKRGAARRASQKTKMEQSKKGNNKIIFILIFFILAATFAVFCFIFLKFDGREMFASLYSDLTAKTQIVGQVKVDRGERSVSIKEVGSPVWNEKTLSPVIGKAYEIKRLSQDGNPVHVEFSYDPSNLPEGISENELGLFRWHDEDGKKYWSPVESQVETGRRVVMADLDSFSILAIKAPVANYLTEEERSDISQKLSELEKDPPVDTCGLLVIMQEEMIAGEGHYERTGDENVAEAFDCRNNGSVQTRNAHFSITRNIDGKDFVYASDATVEWQIDPEKSVTVEGTLRDQNGKPVADASITATQTKYGSRTESTKTNGSGYYSLNLHSGEYLIVGTKAGNECSAVGAREQYCSQGSLSDHPQKQSRWIKDLKIKCSEFEINGNQQIPVYEKFENGGVVIIYDGKSTKYETLGRQVQKIEGGFGWEGKWNLKSDILYEFGLKNKKITGNGGYISFVDHVIRSGGQYEFNFDIPARPAVGSPIRLKGTLVSGGVNELNMSAGTNRIVGGPLDLPIVSDSPSTETEELIKNLDLKCRFISADESGATISCDPEKQFFEKTGAVLRIRRKED